MALRLDSDGNQILWAPGDGLDSEGRPMLFNPTPGGLQLDSDYFREHMRRTQQAIQESGFADQYLARFSGIPGVDPLTAMTLAYLEVTPYNAQQALGGQLTPELLAGIQAANRGIKGESTWEGIKSSAGDFLETAVPFALGSLGAYGAVAGLGGLAGGAGSASAGGTAGEALGSGLGSGITPGISASGIGGGGLGTGLTAGSTAGGIGGGALGTGISAGGASGALAPGFFASESLAPILGGLGSASAGASALGGLGDLLGGLGDLIPNGLMPSGNMMDLGLATAPILAAINYAKNQGPFDTSRLENTYNEFDPSALAYEYDQNTARGRNALTSSLTQRGVMGSSFGNNDITNFQTSRDLGRRSLVNQGLAQRGNLAATLLDAQVKERGLKNDLYGRSLLALGNVFGGRNQTPVFP